MGERERERRKKEEKRRYREDEKKRELDRQIKKAERIAKHSSPDRERHDRRDKADLWEHEKYDRDRRGGRDEYRDRERERTPTGYYGVRDYLQRRQLSPGADEYLDDREKDKRERKQFVDASKMRRVNQFLRQQGIRKEEVEKEMERAYEKYFSSLAKKDLGLPVIPTGR